MNTSEAFLQVKKELEEIRLMLADRNDDIMDVGGVMALTGLSRSAIYQKTCSQGGAPPELPHYKQGKRLYFKRSEVTAWMTQNRVRNRAQLDAEAAAFSTGSRRRGA